MWQLRRPSRCPGWMTGAVRTVEREIAPHTYAHVQVQLTNKVKETAKVIFK